MDHTLTGSTPKPAQQQPVQDASDPFMLAGQVVVVTGGGSGIGRAVVLAFAQAGSRVVVLDRDAVGAERSAALARESGAEATALTCDVADAGSVADAAKASEARFGPCDVLVNNAGIISQGALASISIADWNRVLSINLTGALLCAQAFGAQMRARRRGAMVHMSSVVVDHPVPWSGCYSITKAGVAMLSRLLALEWAEDGIRSNAVKPGLIRTEMTEAFYDKPGLEARRSALIPSRRIGRADDIAQAVLFLASDRASYINGEELVVDGGFQRMLSSLVPREGFDATAPKT
ncbi:SDR family NAD(P)-dependent oxidoreductase [Variovorax saccharolyticus]|uniref:SDR family NAD(P)-dependent oxidoreductase n=1 Tax=Variovorax saccharolyticus TaxID=3053516 RepID=UPI002578BD6F|nr:SDR family oxidoreductase [Variovorax sp. J22R187]MDM0021806.1 SDR family oxidoreductase [Variovorax sp. J22R187]